MKYHTDDKVKGCPDSSCVDSAFDNAEKIRVMRERMRYISSRIRSDADNPVHIGVDSTDNGKDDAVE